MKAVGISGKDGMMLQCKKRYADGEDIGYVGDITGVDPQIIYDLLEKDFLPIICPVGFDEEFKTYNINADDAACAIATAMEAEKLAFLTDVEGVYRDFEDKESLTVSYTHLDVYKRQFNFRIISETFIASPFTLTGTPFSKVMVTYSPSAGAFSGETPRTSK